MHPQLILFTYPDNKLEKNVGNRFNIQPRHISVNLRIVDTSLYTDESTFFFSICHQHKVAKIGNCLLSC